MADELSPAALQQISHLIANAIREHGDKRSSGSPSGSPESGDDSELGDDPDAEEEPYQPGDSRWRPQDIGYLDRCLRSSTKMQQGSVPDG
ncbi:hypothetical protein LTR72_010274 [Exophiala xenobiotica]|nr:hypothetical protein LTR72_010274 [Exophiala xenobiotica]KAK5286966.1 hypothetical protein LTR14_009711 [Exophiala xenobiotica]KAK5478171.1 hypothetical protein LTR55_008155 [Exophiala xenobiotica]